MIHIVYNEAPRTVFICPHINKSDIFFMQGFFPPKSSMLSSVLAEVVFHK